MKWFIFDAVCLTLAYAAGAWTWPKVRLWLIVFRNDPLGTIQKDIDELKAVKDRIVKGL